MAYVDISHEQEMKEWNQINTDDNNSGNTGDLPEEDVPKENLYPSAAAHEGEAPDNVDYVTSEIDTGQNPSLTF